MLGICVAMFANATLILDSTRLDDGTGTINPEALGLPFADAFINQYLTGLGNFTTDNFNGGKIVWTLFLLATLLT